MDPRRPFLLLLAGLAPALGQPAISWVSDPAQPGQSLLLRGAALGPTAVVEAARLPDTEGAGPLAWRRLSALADGDDALCVPVPAEWQPGLFAVRVSVGGQASGQALVNAPQPWWWLGDQGRAVSADGWLRVQGKCLGDDRTRVSARLVSPTGPSLDLRVEAADGWTVRCRVPATAGVGTWRLRLHNGCGGEAGWADGGAVIIAAPAPWPDQVFSVLADEAPDALAQMRRSLLKYGQPVDRTKAVLAALAKAKANGGGVVYFPAGRYRLTEPLNMPPRTVLRGEGMGLVTLWWGQGRFNLDGGGDQGLARDAEPEPPAELISGPSFGVEDLSLYLPLNHRTGLRGDERTWLRRVRMRVDHLWALDGNKRPEGTLVRLGRDGEVTDCDLVAKGTGLVPGDGCLVARNTILAGKTPCPLGGSRRVIVEENRFVSTYPTAYQNISCVGEDLLYARNRHEAASAHQADFSFTFDSGVSCYSGPLAAVDGLKLTLAGDPVYPDWAKERSWYWQRAAVAVVTGRGSGQWRRVAAFTGREWTLAEPFAVPPDTHSLVTVVPLCGRALVIGNRFEDANWVNAGFGAGLDVVYAGNTLVRCAQLLNYGIAGPRGLLPNFGVQYLGNTLSEGLTEIAINGSVRPADALAGAITQNVVVRGNTFAPDNSAGIVLQGALRGALVEGNRFAHADSAVRVERGPSGFWLRANASTAGALRCDGAQQVP